MKLFLKSLYTETKTTYIYLVYYKCSNNCLLEPVLWIYTNLFLLQAMSEYGVYNIIFSSSATVYGLPQYLPVDEKHPVGGCTNPYGKTKLFIEEILLDVDKTGKVHTMDFCYKKTKYIIFLQFN